MARLAEKVAELEGKDEAGVDQARQEILDKYDRIVVSQRKTRKIIFFLILAVLLLFTLYSLR